MIKGDAMNITIRNTGLQAQGVNTRYGSDIKVFNLFAQGRTITPELVKEFFQSRQDKSAATLSRNRAAIKAALLNGYGQDITLLQRAEIEQFFKTIKTGKRDSSIPESKILTRLELHKLLKNSGPKTAVLIQALFETACRCSELLDIKLTDCDIQGDLVSVKIRHGKGNRERVVQMSLSTFNRVKDLYQGEEFLFPIHRNTVSILLKKTGKRILNRNLTPHMLRHSWATIAYESGMLNITQISKYLGHQKISTTVDCYFHGRASAAEISEFNNFIIAA